MSLMQYFLQGSHRIDSLLLYSCIEFIWVKGNTSRMHATMFFHDSQRRDCVTVRLESQTLCDCTLASLGKITRFSPTNHGLHSGVEILEEQNDVSIAVIQCQCRAPDP